MVGRSRDPVAAVMGLDASEPKRPSFRRRLSNFWRRSSNPQPLRGVAVSVDGTFLTQPGGGPGLVDSGAHSFSQLPPVAAPPPIRRGSTVVDPHIVFGSKNFAVATSSGIRASNEDRSRVVNSLELFAKGLIAIERKKHGLQEMLTQRTLESYVANGNAPEFDEKKLLRQKIPTSTSFFGVFDGHGGDYTSSMLALLLPVYLLQAPAFATDLTSALQSASLALNEEILKRDTSGVDFGGSTAVTLLIRKGVAYICNIGDCRAILLTRQGVTALTTDHKAGLESEKQRIEDAGGMVLYVKGVPRVNGRLAVARSFGDAELKELVMPLPDVSRHVLSAEDDYIVMASDGLWDVLSNEQVASCIRYAQRVLSKSYRTAHTLYYYRNHPWLSLDDLCQVLVNRAIELGSLDNVTVLIVDVRSRR